MTLRPQSPPTYQYIYVPRQKVEDGHYQTKTIRKDDDINYITVRSLINLRKELVQKYSGKASCVDVYRYNAYGFGGAEHEGRIYLDRAFDMWESYNELRVLKEDGRLGRKI